MCLIIDTNTFSPIFDSENPNHEDFAAVKEWILDGPGKVVYGGSKYLKEIQSFNAARKILVQLEKIGKTVKISKSDVDSEATKITALLNDPDLDDEHLIAIIKISKCKILCTLDKRSDKFTRSTKPYACSKDRPKIYRYKSHLSLLKSCNIAAICKS